MTADVVSTVFFASLEHRAITNRMEPFIFVALEFVTPFLKSKKFDWFYKSLFKKYYFSRTLIRRFFNLATSISWCILEMHFINTKL